MVVIHGDLPWYNPKDRIPTKSDRNSHTLTRGFPKGALHSPLCIKSKGLGGMDFIGITWHPLTSCDFIEEIPWGIRDPYMIPNILSTPHLCLLLTTPHLFGCSRNLVKTLGSVGISPIYQPFISR